VTLLVVVLLAGIVFAALSGQRSAGKGARRVRKGSFSPLWLLVAVLVGFVLLRFGMHWLAVVGGVLLAASRALLPLLRFLPLLRSFRSGAPGSAGPGSARWARGDADGHASGPEVRKPARMSRQEALQVLGLDRNATNDDVRREYRRLMKKLHPDLGGSGYLAAKINEAKDVLL
jgi:DnaJ homolog subfamily C member 19